jgi:dCTP deaminase
MFLTNRDVKWAVQCGKLIVDPPPEHFGAGYDETSIDLHLDAIDVGTFVWDLEAYRKRAESQGAHATSELPLGSFDWKDLARRYLVPVPEESGQARVFRRGDAVIVKPLGFILWTTKERIGTPQVDPQLPLAGQRQPELICFVNAKSTKARTGLLVHFTAPTIHAGWAGKVTLEITNLGPFDFVLRENDAIAQLTVATISSAPDLDLRKSKQQTQGQTDPSGAPPRKTRRTKKQ